MWCVSRKFEMFEILKFATPFQLNWHNSKRVLGSALQFTPFYFLQFSSPIGRSLARILNPSDLRTSRWCHFLKLWTIRKLRKNWEVCGGIFWARILIMKVLLSEDINFQKDVRRPRKSRPFDMFEILKLSTPFQLNGYNSKTILDFTLHSTAFDFLQFSILIGRSRLLNPFDLRTPRYEMV